MNLSVLTPSKKPSELTYDVLIENQEDGKVLATVIGLPDCQAIGATKEEALTSLYERLTERLAKAEIVSIKIEPPKAEHPWMKFAGMFKDDPQFDDMLADIEAYRRELDAEMEEYYRKLDAEDEAK
ncbi:type II toxin-antitoxin system HicB family antitoxin [Hassallia byssoidea VB512170]|uniref:Type II toxin-antitoxin system HicB family antitoxin n=1 Tax=Hassallia byssoidea VB512170 TaxID=1304833 RepID=A0A846H717_9CYAN|nr:type II toxin-antitoxin system HicB family antitoxin [Hassalia byssoidea VB512170]